MKRQALLLLALPLAACQPPPEDYEDATAFYKARNVQQPVGRFVPAGTRQEARYTEVFVLDTRTGAICRSLIIDDTSEMTAPTCGPIPSVATP